MATKNIFAGKGVRITFVNLLYNKLMKREFVTLADIMCILLASWFSAYFQNTQLLLDTKSQDGTFFSGTFQSSTRGMLWLIVRE